MKTVKLYKNTGYVFIILFVFVMVGFFKTYFSLFPGFNANITYVVHIHFVFLMSWIILLMLQPLLIRYKRYDAHRFVGRLTYFIAPAIVLSLISLMFKHYYDVDMRGWPIEDVIGRFYFQGVHTISFAVFYILAVVHKKNTYLHATYMIATGIVFIKPSLTRVLLHTTPMHYTIAETIVILFIDIVIISLLFYVKHKKQNYRPYILVLTMLLFYHIPSLIQLWS